jgi:hypothetical protein
MKETVHVRESLFDKASEIASEFKIKEIRPCNTIIRCFFDYDYRSQRNNELLYRQPIWLLENEYPYTLPSWII